MTLGLADEVLRRLIEAGGEAVSGENLARASGVTRAAVWKAIENLRRDGYEVASVPSKGYSLAASTGALREAEVAARLATSRFGRVLRVLASVDSTNREAARWAADGAPDGAVVVAATQTAGRGRLGRSWFGAAGETLMASVVVRPKGGPQQASLITYVAAVALAEAFAKWVDEAAIEIKWPNDVLLRGRKVAGILLESRIEGGLVDFVAVGVGVNVSGSRVGLPEELRGFAGVLAEEAGPGEPPTVVELLAEFLGKFEAAFDLFSSGGFSALAARFGRWFKMKGKFVTITVGERKVSGTVEGIDADGSLVIKTEAGREVFFAGDVAFATTKG